MKFTEHLESDFTLLYPPKNSQQSGTKKCSVPSEAYVMIYFSSLREETIHLASLELNNPLKNNLCFWVLSTFHAICYMFLIDLKDNTI